MELNERPRAFSELIGSVVEDQSGRRLGRVFEVRARWERDGSVVFDELLLGRAALWRRLRGPRHETRGIPWARVVEIGADRVVVRD